MKHQSLAFIVFGALLTFGFAVLAMVLVPMADPTLGEPTAVAQAYGELEALGRAVYQREGCAYCHSQQVRSVDTDRPFGTWVSQPGDYAHDVPHPMGLMRVGPDLRFAGDRQESEDWYVQFLADPHTGSAHPMMPSYGHLPERELRALAAYLASRRGGYEEAPLMVAEEPTSPFAGLPDRYAAMENPLARTADVIRLGGQRFDTFCASCHGTAGDGRGPAAMALNPPPADFTNPMYREAPDAYLYWRIAEGVPGTGMPAWETAFTEEEIWEMVHYLREFHGG